MGEIHPNNLMARQTGYWPLANIKRIKVQQVVVVHNSVVSRIFKNILWHICDEQPGKVGYTGDETDTDNLVGTMIQKWKTQATWTYSNDIDPRLGLRRENLLLLKA